MDYVAGTKQRRIQAAMNEEVLKQFNNTYVGIELVDNPGTIVRALLDSGAALSVFSLRSVRRVWHTMKRTLRQSVAVRRGAASTLLCIDEKRAEASRSRRACTVSVSEMITARKTLSVRSSFCRTARSAQPITHY